jgi:hypothetical protein
VVAHFAAFVFTILNNDQIRISEHVSSCLEGNAVLCQIALRFARFQVNLIPIFCIVTTYLSLRELCASSALSPTSVVIRNLRPSLGGLMLSM